MKGKRFSEDKIIGILKEAEAGVKLSDLCRTHGFCEQTYYRWKSKYGGMDVSEARRLKQLEEENRRLKRAVADLTLDNQIFEGYQLKKMVKPAARKQAVVHAREEFGVSERRACGLMRIGRSSFRYRSVGQLYPQLRERLLELAAQRVRFGYRRLQVLLRREGYVVNYTSGCIGCIGKRD